MLKRTAIVAAVIVAFAAWKDVAPADAAEIPANTWVRVADAPGDPLGREVPPGRGATWTYVPETGRFYRYGGYTPRMSNALDSFDPVAKTWQRLKADDENYPADRPGAAADALITWDPQRKVVWIAGGMSRGFAGQRGIWKYDPKTDAFTVESATVPPYVGRMAFDYRRGVFVAAPTSSTNVRDSTPVYSLAAKKWESKRAKPTPQETYSGNWPLVYHEASGKVVLVKGFSESKPEKVEVWAFDTASFAWEILHDGTKGEAPSAKDRRAFTIAYEPQTGAIMLHGGSDGREDGRFETRSMWNDTWFFDVKKKTWTEIKTPGPPLPTTPHGKKRAEAIIYRTALAHDADRGLITLSDPDLGVWDFRYAPGEAAGKEALAGDWTPGIGKAARELAPIKGPPDVFRALPSALNPRIEELPDNTAVALSDGGYSGAEIPWDYDVRRGIFMKYGGCGNSLNPFWGGYGNDLSYYDPFSETFHLRRAGDVSGADRPGSGCTRSIIYDSHRQVFWFYGGSSGVPYTGSLVSGERLKGTWAYSVADDRFTRIEPKRDSAPGPKSHACYLVYDPEHRCIISPAKGETYIFDTRTAAWSIRQTPSSPGEMVNYTRLVYVHSLKGVLWMSEVRTGETSKTKPSEARTPKEAAGRDTVFWTQDSKTKEWVEWTLKTLLYDYEHNEWKDLSPKGQPTFRNNKYGLAYDAANDVVLLVGGNIGWNGPVVADMWAYSVKDNAWVKLDPRGAAIPYGQNLRTVYDMRHNATLIGADQISRHQLVAYRYKRGTLPAGFIERLTSADKTGNE